MALRDGSGMQLHHGNVRFINITDETCTVIGKDRLNGDKVRIDNVPWDGLESWDCGKGVLIQDALPMLKDDEREFLISGLGPRSFKELFPAEEGE